MAGGVRDFLELLLKWWSSAEAASGFYDIAALTYIWLQVPFQTVRSIGPDLRSAPQMIPDLEVAGLELTEVRSAPVMVPKIDEAKQI